MGEYCHRKTLFAVFLINSNLLFSRLLNLLIIFRRDLGSAFGPQMRQYALAPFVQSLLQAGRNTEDETLLSTCEWAEGVLQRL